MNKLYPIHTMLTECHDCYKCVRQCPVKAIRIDNGHASIMSDRCVACGKCVQICPAKAKHVRSDLLKVKEIVKNKKTYVSLAPSYISTFKGISESQMITALKWLGFTGVSETALGAEEVSKFVATSLRDNVGGLHISSACPASVDYVRLYLPEYADYITPVASPALTHAKMLKKELGEDVGVVFIGPCIAKKNESDRNFNLLDAALSFDELREWFKQEKINLLEIPGREEQFLLKKAADGVAYPVEGGMIATIRQMVTTKNIHMFTVVGLKHLTETLNGIDPRTLKESIFIEALACKGGCINGPCSSRKYPILTATTAIWNKSVFAGTPESKPEVVCGKTYEANPISEEVVDAAKIKKALASVGKYDASDELNCGGCGYDTCRQFAKALVLKNAEVSMCLSHMRTIANRKANALLRCMPSGVVIVDKNLTIVESNEAFASMFGEDMIELFKIRPGLNGVVIGKVFPCEDLFKAALRSGNDIKKERFPVSERLFDLSIFTVEPGQTIGMIIEDVTKTEMRRDQIAKRAREVISKNISAVQEIACRLGEHMADTEVLLSSIADGYGTDEENGKIKKGDGSHKTESNEE